MFSWILILTGFLSSGSTDYLAVAPSELKAGLAPLIAWREETGRRVRVISPDELGAAPSAEGIRREVRKEYEEGGKRLKYLLLVGDVGEGGIPTFIQEHYRWVETDERKMATDVPYGDMEGDFLPEVAVGRLPVRNKEELDRVVRKIIRFESEPREGERRLKLVLFGGASGFPPAADTFLESITRNMVDSLLPLRYDIKVIFANLPSPYCPPPDQLGSRFMDLINEGPALSMFVGHGSRDSCYGLAWKRGRITQHCGLHQEQLSLLEEESIAGPLFYVACDNGFFDGEEDCLAEATLLNPGGPVAAVGASRYSHPLTNLYYCQALLESLEKNATLGKLLLQVLEESHKKSIPMANMFLRNVEGNLDGDVDLTRLKEDQVHVYNLMGDPATMIRLPRPLELQASLDAGGTGIDLQAHSPMDEAEGYAALYRARSWAPSRKHLPDPEREEDAWRREKSKCFNRVNDKEMMRFPLEVTEGELKKRLPLMEVPPPGRYRLVVYLRDGKADAAGAVTLTVR